MPSLLHESLIAMIRDRPDLAVELLNRAMLIDVPAFTDAQLTSEALTEVRSTEYRADAVVLLKRDRVNQLAIVVEVQLRTSTAKRYSWPVYVTTLRARMKCPVLLLVITSTRNVAKWCAAPISLGPPGSVVTPVAFGPEHIPVVADRETARQTPELTVMSVLAHATEDKSAPMFGALLAALDVIDPDTASGYADLVLKTLPAAISKSLGEFMTTTENRFQSEFMRNWTARAEAVGEARGEAIGEARGEARGVARGEAQALLVVLDTRGVAIPDDVRARITGCTDTEQLGAWLGRAVTAEKIDDVDASFAL